MMHMLSLSTQPHFCGFEYTTTGVLLFSQKIEAWQYNTTELGAVIYKT